MEDYQKRVVDEKSELDKKITLLKEFIYSKQYRELPNDEQLRLVNQLSTMIEYSRILNDRIRYFPKEQRKA